MLIGAGLGGMSAGATVIGAAIKGGSALALVLGGTASTGAAIAIGSTQMLIGGAIAIGGIAVGTMGGNVLLSKHNPGMSNKPPVSWTDINEGIEVFNVFGGNSEKATEFLLNEKYGVGKWSRGARTEYNALKKWFDRIIRKMIGGNL